MGSCSSCLNSTSPRPNDDKLENKIEDPNRSKNRNWMGMLPMRLKEKELTDLAIPGSHNSSTFYLDKSGPVTSDGSCAIKMVSNLPNITETIIFKWSETQSMDFGKQLDLGIRYFDMRTYFYKDDFYSGHGLYGPKMLDSLMDINKFLDANKEEVVILDFNNFYDFTEELHDKFVKQLKDIFGSKLSPSNEDIILKEMIKLGHQVIAVYYDETSVEKDKENKIWEGTSLSNFFPDTSDIHKLKTLLDSWYKNKNVANEFTILQGILTPDTGLILGNLNKSLKEVCAKPASEWLVPWLKNKPAGKTGINVCTLDYVEMNEFAPTVIGLNFK